jgi:carbamoyl-phosphate synthase large subunit
MPTRSRDEFKMRHARSSPTVFVSGVGGCGVGEGVAKAIRRSKRQYRLLCGNMHADAPMLFKCDGGFILPPATDSDYISVVLELCREERVSVFVPGSEAELRVVARAAAEFASSAVHLLAASPEVVAIGDDKWNSHLFLEQNGFSSPATSLVPVETEFLQAACFPLVVKPRMYGRGSQDLAVVRSVDELSRLLAWLEIRDIEAIVQRHIGSDCNEYTASVVVGRNRTVLGSIAMRRRMLGGFTSHVEIEDFPEVRQECERIALALGVFGPVNLQARMDGGKLVVFDINPRFSGTTPFRAAVGFNEVEMMLEYLLWGEVPGFIPVRYGTLGTRGFDEMIVSRLEYDRIRLPHPCAPKLAT